jgi:hopene-associated glycosyltransferase HpnB
MAQGLAAAGIPAATAAAGAAGQEPRYVLFTDADIAWDPGALRRLVAAAEGDDRDLVSQMALLRTATRWERVVVPAFVYFFAQLYPFRWVNAPGSRTAAAAGGCMLVRSGALDRSGGLAPISGALIDDVAMGRMIKRQRGRCWLGLSRQVVSVRPYPRLAHLWQMIARSAYTQLNYSPALLVATIAGLLFIYALPPASAITGLAAGAVTAPAALAAGAGLAGWALMSLSYLPMLRLYRLSPLRVPGLPLIALLYAAMTADSARRHYTGRGAEWRGRANRTRLGLLPWQTNCSRANRKRGNCGPGTRGQGNRRQGTCRKGTYRQANSGRAHYGRTSPRLRPAPGTDISSPTCSLPPRLRATSSRCSLTGAAWTTTLCSGPPGSSTCRRPCSSCPPSAGATPG